MARYLIDRIAATPVIELRYNIELTQLYDEPTAKLAAITWRDKGLASRKSTERR